MIEPLKAPFPWFGGKSRAAELVWQRFGDVRNYVEPFAGSAAMLLAAPNAKRIETINDFDGFVANFWRAISADPDAVAYWADWPCNESDLEARHAWLVNRSERLRWQLEDPDFYDAKIAGWWCWGLCNWIGSGFCEGKGPHVTNGANLFDTRQLPHLGDAGQGINRQLPHLGDAGQGINRKLPHLGDAGRDRSVFILDWMQRLHARLRDVRVACGDWSRVVKESVTIRHGLTAVFLDPPYAVGKMQYAGGGMGTNIAQDVAAWCGEHGDNPKLRIALCGHAGEHDALLGLGWSLGQWKARKGYAATDEAKANTAGESIWFSPHCVAASEFTLGQEAA